MKDIMTIEAQIEKHVGERLYPIGFTFTHKRGKQPAKEKTVLNYAITFNAAGNVTCFEYVLSYDFLGQRMTENVAQTTIDIATNNGWEVSAA